MNSRLKCLVSVLLVTGVTSLTTGCATIVHSGPRTLPVATTPPGASVSIYNRSGAQVSRQTTPFIATLPVKHRYFSGQTYRLVFEMPGYQPSEIQLKSTVSGWYFGNILFGGLIGMLIVDPATGAMYNLSADKVDQVLTPVVGAQVDDAAPLRVISMAQATSEQRAAMELVQPAR